MGPWGRTPGTRAGKRAVLVGEVTKIASDGITVAPKTDAELRRQIKFLSKTGHSAPQVIALPREQRQRRVTYGLNAWRAS